MSKKIPFENMIMVIDGLPVLPHRNPQDVLGFLGAIPSFISMEDPRPVVEQINEHYQHGGGWRDMQIGGEGWTMLEGDCLKYPEDPKMTPVARTQVREEKVIFYEYALVAVVQKDGSFRVARID